MSDKCTNKCPGRLDHSYITETYTRKGSDIQVTVTGIPAEICPICGESFTSSAVTEEIGRLVKPLLDFGVSQHHLPTPKIRIEFPEVAAVA